jgi:hypothetical protein
MPPPWRPVFDASLSAEAEVEEAHDATEAPH